MSYYVYLLCEDNTPFYVGIGKGDRAYWHEKYARGETSLGYGLTNDYNPRKTRKIQKILRQGKQINYQFPYSNLQELKEALEIEKHLIKYYGRKGIDKDGILYNLHPGGLGGDTFTYLSEEKKKQRRQKNSFAVKNRSEETLDKIRKASTGRKHTNEAKEKISASQKGKNNNMFGKISPKKGKPATGGNAKGVRKAWNKGKNKNNDESMARISEKIKTHQENNPQGIYYKLISPAGEIVEGKGINGLVRNHNVSHRIMPLIKGEKDIYKGWRRYED
jgi:hypothetical protein